MAAAQRAFRECAPVAQLDRVPPYEGVGCPFEPGRARQNFYVKDRRNIYVRGRKRGQEGV